MYDITQGYRALLEWREAAGPEFEIRRLVQVLRSCKMDDVAEVAASLIDSKSQSVYYWFTSQTQVTIINL